MEELVQIDPSDLRVQPPFSTLFTVKPEIVEAITASMKATGYDPATPIIVWREQNVVIDGHTRREAAIAAGRDAYVYFHSFPDEDSAVLYAVACQKNRRNTTQAELLNVIKAVDQIKKKGGDRKSEKSMMPRGTIDPERSAEATAKAVGVSARTVNRARLVMKDAEATKAVESGQVSINKAAKQVKAKKANKPHVVPAAILAAVAANAAAAKPAFVITPEPYREETRQPEQQLPTATQSEAQAAYPTSQYREDVKILRDIQPELDQINAKINQTGHRNSLYTGPIFRALVALCNARDMETGWEPCPKCSGTGISNKLCSRCGGAGYSINGL